MKIWKFGRAVLKVGMILEYISEDDYKEADPLITEEYFKLVSFDKALNRNPDKYRGYTAKIVK